jgi:hypothetical protein
MNITDLEREMIVRIAESEYGDRPEDPTWVCVVCETHQDAGVLSSLSRKGLVKIQGEYNENDSIIRLTSEGLNLYRSGS